VLLLVPEDELLDLEPVLSDVERVLVLPPVESEEVLVLPVEYLDVELPLLVVPYLAVLMFEEELEYVLLLLNLPLLDTELVLERVA
jgi:hypothetical protein